MKERGEKNWLFIKKKDDQSRKQWILTQALNEEKLAALKETPCHIS
jgi:hypothetical protein